MGESEVVQVDEKQVRGCCAACSLCIMGRPARGIEGYKENQSEQLFASYYEGL